MFRTCEVVSVWRVETDGAVEYRCHPESQQAAECVKGVLRTVKAMYDWGSPTEFVSWVYFNFLFFRS